MTPLRFLCAACALLAVCLTGFAAGVTAMGHYLDEAQR